MTASAIDNITPPIDALGECPVWDGAAGALYWTDIEAPALHRWDAATGGVRSWPMPAALGSFCLDVRGAPVLALATGLARLDPASGAIAPWANGAVVAAGHRFNDGAVDPAGRFIAGTMHRSTRAATGAFWRLDESGGVSKVLDGLRVPNGPVWSRDGRRFYWNDSPIGMFTAGYDEDGGIGMPARFAAEAGAPGFPDGSALDADGCLWNARWDGGGIARFTPEGALDRFVALPVSRPTSCCFGGADFATLFVTTARIGLGAAQLADEPLAGAVLALRPGVGGLAQRRFGLRGP